MIVICPACRVRYLVDPRALGTRGRTVRCTECRHVWPQLPAEDAPRRVDRPLPRAAKRPPRHRWSPAVVALGVIVVLGLWWLGR